MNLTPELDAIERENLRGRGSHVQKQHIADLLAEVRALQAKLAKCGVCEVCWTNSWVPAPSEAECALVHPHEGEHVRCDHCWLHEAFTKRDAALRKLVERMRERQDGISLFWSDELSAILEGKT